MKPEHDSVDLNGQLLIAMPQKIHENFGIFRKPKGVVERDRSIANVKGEGLFAGHHSIL